MSETPNEGKTMTSEMPVSAAEAVKFRTGEIWDTGHGCVYIVEPASLLPQTYYDEETGETTEDERVAVQVERIPATPAPPSGGQWIDQSCFSSMRRIYGPSANDKQQTGELPGIAAQERGNLDGKPPGYVCPVCGGTGWNKIPYIKEDPRRACSCSRCSGTGIVEGAVR